MSVELETSESDKYDIRHYTNEDCFINNKPKVSKFQVKPKNDLGRFPANIIHDGGSVITQSILFSSIWLNILSILSFIIL